jgi:hypothetical protein
MSGRLTPVGECDVCHLRVAGDAWRCDRCRKLYKRGDARKLPDGTPWKIDRPARLKAMRRQWDPRIKAFRCAYTNLPLTSDYGPLHATWEHRKPGDPSSVVLVAWLVNDMKTDLSERDFKKMIRALAAHFAGTKRFQKNNLPQSWWRVVRPQPPAAPPPPRP